MSGVHRPTVDSKGKIWFAEMIGDALGMLDPDTGKITEYKNPLRYSGEYECYADKEDHIWATLRSFGAFGRFDQKTKKYTFIPYPEINGHTPKVETDPDGTLWFAMGRPSTVANLRINGNVPTGHSAGM